MFQCASLRKGGFGSFQCVTLRKDGLKEKCIVKEGWTFGVFKV